MVGGEEGVSTLQHARLAARPAGRQPRPPSANTTAPAWDRERGVAGWRSAAVTDPSLIFLYRYTSDSCKRGERTSLTFTPDHTMDIRL